MLLCSDLLHQSRNANLVTESDVVGRCREVLANYLPYGPFMDATLKRLAALQPKTLATMHGSVYVGDGRKALHDLAGVFWEVLGAS